MLSRTYPTAVFAIFGANSLSIFACRFKFLTSSSSLSATFLWLMISTFLLNVPRNPAYSWIDSSSGYYSSALALTASCNIVLASSFASSYNYPISAIASYYASASCFEWNLANSWALLSSSYC